MRDTDRGVISKESMVGGDFHAFFRGFGTGQLRPGRALARALGRFRRAFDVVVGAW